MAQMHRLTSWSILFVLSIIWGSSFILIKKSLIAFSYDEVAALRISICTIAFIPVYLFFIRRKIPLKKLPYVALVGLTGSGIPAFMYALAQTRVDSAVAGILNSTTPVFTWILGLLFFHAIYKKYHLVGVIFGFIGASGLILLDYNKLSFDFHSYSLFILVGSVCYAISGNIVKSYLQDVHPISLTAVAFFFIGLFAIGYLISTDVVSDLDHPEATLSLLSVIILSLVGTVFSNIIFFALIQQTNAVFAASVSYLIPVTAIFWGFLDGEMISITHVLGLSFILLGIFALRRQ
jgi:drug/metabolite transporter (DMT)-like permease